jgi:type IV pilus assembly protein PilM
MLSQAGLDIGMSTVKLVTVEKDKNRYVLLALGEAKSPVGNWVSGGEEAMKRMAVAIKGLVKDVGLKEKKVVFSLPENEVVSRLIPLPAMKENEIKAALRFEAETFIPYPLSEVQIDYEIVSKDETGKIFVFAVAAKTELIDKYLKLLKMSGLEPLAVETQAVALVRSVQHSTELDKSVMLIDLGDKFSDVVVFKDRKIFMTRVVPVGGESFTRAISVGLGLDMSSAEEYKKAYGMTEGELEGKIKQAVSPVFSSLADEIRKAMISYRDEWGNSVDLIVLSGGGANMPGLSEELVRILSVEVQVIQPFLRIDTNKVVLPIDLNRDSCRFALATGLALRGIYDQ